MDQENLLEQRHVVADRRPAQTKRAGEFSEIEQLTCLGRRQRHDLRQGLELPDAGEVLDIPLGDGLDVSAISSPTRLSH